MPMHNPRQGELHVNIRSCEDGSNVSTGQRVSEIANSSPETKRETFISQIEITLLTH